VVIFIIFELMMGDSFVICVFVDDEFSNSL